VKASTKTLSGYIGVYSEQGMEGYSDWMFFDESGSNDMFEIEENDHLKVFGENNEIIFDGRIIPDRKTNPRKRRKFGYFWIQRGWIFEEWEKLFVYSNLEGSAGKFLHAEYTPAKKSRSK
jgi:hypothetical protein